MGMARICSYLTAMFGGAFFAHLMLVRAAVVGETAVQTILGIICGVFLTSAVLWIVAVKLYRPTTAAISEEVERIREETLRHFDDYLRSVSAWVNQAQPTRHHHDSPSLKKE